MSEVTAPIGGAVPAIRCVGLSKRYGRVAALRDLDLEVAPGAIFGFLGRNGAGKTTTMRLLAGLATPTSGRAWINGVEATDADRRAREQFGYLPQEPAFYGWMTGREYLAYAGRLSGLGREQRRVRVSEMLALADLGRAADRPIAGYSGGMKQRLGVVQALLHEPPVLLLDEPTSSLDPAGRHALLSLIAGLRGRTTVFLSSHILADVERVCDTIGIIDDGRLVVVAGREALLATHAGNVVELIVERGADLAPFLAALEGQTWLVRAAAEVDRLRLVVTDLDAARPALLTLISEHALPLLRFDWVRPSLEEVFLSLSGAGAPTLSGPAGNA